MIHGHDIFTNRNVQRVSLGNVHDVRLAMNPENKNDVRIKQCMDTNSLANASGALFSTRRHIVSGCQCYIHTQINQEYFVPIFPAYFIDDQSEHQLYFVFN